MNSLIDLKMFFSMFAVSAPLLIACLVGVFVVINRWKQAPGAARWALAAFVLGAALCFLIPLAQTIVQHWLVEGGNMSQRAWVFGALSMVWSVLRATTYILLLVAVFAGRVRTEPTPRG